MAKKRKQKLTLEALEDRLTPATWGITWPNPGHMTLSFVPDGTSVSNAQSSLFQSLNAVAPTSAWEQEILRAFQNWAVNANINIGVVADGGQPLGTSGAVQGDSRFGDSRIAMAPLASTTALAQTAPFDLSGSTWSGDMLFNSLYNFGINGAGQYDLFTVALHEAGHVFGFGDQTTDPTSANYAVYTGPRSGLSSGDIAALQSLYGGPRSPDTQTNNSLASALNLTNPDQAPVTADISSSTDADFFSFTTQAASGGGSTTSFTVQTNAAGLSLLEPSVTVFDSSGHVVGSGAAADPLNNNVTVQISNAQPNATYYVEVTGATSSVFGIGRYQTSIKFPTSTTPAAPGSVPTSTTPAAPGGTVSVPNNSFATALPLTAVQMSANSQGYTYNAAGNIAAPAQGDYYQVTAPTLPVAGSETMTITAASTDANGLNPYVTVYDATQHLIPSMVINNGGGTFTVQLTGVSPGSVYFVEVSALPGATQNVGNYSLAVQFNNAAATSFAQLSSATLTQNTIIGYQSLTATQSGLMNFMLAADVGGSTVASAVRMTIYDQNNNQVFTMVTFAGQPPSTGFVFLEAGNYTIRYNAATQTGAALPSLALMLAARRISDPMDPLPIDPTLTGTGGTGITVGSSTGGSVGTLPIVNPYSSPTTSASTSPTTSASTSPTTSASTSPTTSASTSPTTSASTSPTTPASIAFI